MKTFNLSDAFEKLGHWWLPNSPDQQVAGTLRHSHEGIRLSLSRTFEEALLPRLLAGHYPAYPHVLGVTDDGTAFTLYEVMVSRWQTSSHFPAQCECHVQSAIADSHAPAQKDLTAKEVRLSVAGLDAFASFHPLRIVSNDRPIRMLAEYTPPSTIEARIEPIGAVLKVGTHASSSKSQTEATLRAWAELLLRPDKPQSLEWCTETVSRICQFFTLLFDDLVTARYLRLKLPNDQTGWLLHGSRSPYEEIRGPLIFNLGGLENELSKLLSSWFSVSGSLLSATHLYVDGKSGHNTIDSRLIVLTQALEAFCRAVFPSEITQRTRINAFLNSLQPATVRRFCNDRTNFVAGLVATRNYLTHYGDDLKASALDHLDLYWLCEKIGWFLRLGLLRHLGCDEDDVTRRMTTFLGGSMAAARKAREHIP